MGGVPPYLSYFPGRVGGQDDAFSGHRQACPTVNQRETHFTDSGKETFRQTTVNQVPGRLDQGGRPAPAKWALQ